MKAEGLAAFFRSILEHMAAQIILSVLGSIAIVAGLTQTEALEDLANWRVWLPILLGFVLIGPLARSRWLSHRRIRAASGKKITLLIAKLDGDNSGNLRESICESIKSELGNSVELFRWPDALIVKDGADEAADASALRTAHKWLKNKRCEIGRAHV